MSVNTDLRQSFFAQVSHNFYQEVCKPRSTAMYALGGFLLGKDLAGISPLHGAVYVSTSILAYRVTAKVNNVFCAQINYAFDQLLGYNKVTNRVFYDSILPLKAFANLYLGYTVGSQILFLLGKRITLKASLIMPFASGVLGFTTYVLICCIHDRLLNLMKRR